ncbi:hypothetical protein SSPIM334S_03069 [Streptomyces spiroverticillatus]|uniref:hypothetical protein n=1 Tax=Streptomyces finlayi TaxID=67296 RepID=UPI00167327E6|nr:hypothetical protein [Streptomyces finlayi]
MEAFRHAALLQRALVNHGEMIGVKNVFEQTLDSHAPIPSGYLDVVREVYAEPYATPIDVQDGTHGQHRSFDGAYALLRPEGSVLVLDRPPGTSRTITAYALLARLVEDGLVKEVWPVSFGGSQYFPAKRLPHEHHRGYVLELPTDEDDFEIHESFGANVEAIQHTLAKRHCRLIVLTTPEQWRRIRRGAPEGIAPPLGKARPADIATRWLRAEQPGFPVDEWLRNQQIQTLLEGQGPTEVLRIVELIQEARRDALRSVTSGSPGINALQRRRAEDEVDLPASIAEQASSVAAARKNWEDDLYTWHEKPGRTSFQRNFLLAASVLRGASVGHVYAKAADLTEKLEDEKIKVTGQQAPGVIAMTRAISAERTSDGTIRFTRPHWDDAALEYFWNDRPLSRGPFLEWLAQAPLDEPKEALESVGRDDRRALAERIGEFAVRWAVRHRRQEPLEEIVKAWHAQTKDKGDKAKDKGLWPLAVGLLDSAAVQPASAPYIQAMLLSWAMRKDLSLQLAVVSVCTGEFGRTHTGKALRRLRHTAMFDHPDVASALQDAVRTLWADVSVRRMLFGYVVEWCGMEKIRGTVGLRTFAALAASARPDGEGIPLLLDNSDAEEEDSFRPPVAGLVSGWRTLLRQGPGPTEDREVDKAVYLWLDAALHHPALKSLILDSLRRSVDVRGTEEGRALRETLRTCAHGWVQGPGRPFADDREALRQELGALLDSDLYTAVQHRHAGNEPDPVRGPATQSPQRASGVEDLGNDGIGAT